MTTTKTTLTVAAILAAYKALGALDGFQKAVGERIAFVPYKLTDETRRRIAKNRRVLKPYIDEHQEQQLAVIREVSGGESHISEKDEAAMGAYNARMFELGRETEDVELVHIAEAELLAGEKNPIPPSVLEDLAPITDELAKAPEPEGGE